MAPDTAKRRARLFVKWFPIVWLACLVGGMAAMSLPGFPFADAASTVALHVFWLGAVWLAVGPRLKAGYLLFAWFMLQPFVLLAVEKWTGTKLLDLAHPTRSLLVVSSQLTVPAVVYIIYKLFRPHRTPSRGKPEHHSAQDVPEGSAPGNS